MALYLTELEVRELLPMEAALAAVRASSARLAAGGATNLPRGRVRTSGAVLNVMAAGNGPDGESAVKVYSISRRHGTRFLLLLYDAEGRLASVMEADTLGQVRTGAASGVATDLLARAGVTRLGMIGAGWQARSQLEAVCAVRPIADARVYARDAERLAAFCREMEPRVRAALHPAASARDAVEGADVAVTVTTSAEPVLLGDWLAPGMHLNAAGGNFPNRRELDDEAVRRCDRVVVDDRRQAQLEAGDLLGPARAGAFDWESAVELGAVVAGLAPGRAGESDVTLFKSCGLAAWDLAVGLRVLERARAEGAGREIPFEAPDFSHRAAAGGRAS